MNTPQRPFDLDSAQVPQYTPRVGATVTVLVLAGFLAGLPAWILLALVPDFLLRAFDRPDLASTAWIYRRLVAPLLSSSARSSTTAWPPKRFASRVGLGCLAAILATAVLWPGAPVAAGLALLMAGLAGLEAVLGLCVACRFYSLLGRYHLVEACAGGQCDRQGGRH